MTARATAAALAGALLAASSCRAPCDVTGEAGPDYAKDEAWVCRPGGAREGCGVDLSATDVLADGGTALEPFAPAPAPRAACFYVYPTIDLRLLPGLHTELSDRADQQRTVAAQAARLQRHCTLHAPLYRQVTLGTYAAKAETRSACFDAAFADVRRAFEQFLSDVGPSRPLVLVGHSQGGQHVSRLLRERFDDGGDLAPRLVVGLPIGWAVATAEGQPSGGSYRTLPLCERPGQVGCVVAFRSYAEGNPVPTIATQLVEGPSLACVNPAAGSPDGGTAGLEGAYFPVSHPSLSLRDVPPVSTPFVRYGGFYTGRCVREGANAGLEVGLARAAGDVRRNPVDFGAPSLSGDTGTHLLDMQFVQGDVVRLVGEKVTAYGP